MGIFKLIRAFQKANGRSPSPSELDKLKQQADIMSKQENVIPFPQGGKDKLNPFDDFKASEDAYEQAQKLTPIEAMKEANNLIGRKGKYKNISSKDAEKKLGELEEIIKSEKLEPEDLVGDDLGDMLKDYDGDPDAMAAGGLAGAITKLQKKFGKKIIQKGKAPKKSEKKKLKDLFKEFNKKNMASGGLAGLLGEEPRSEYSAGGATGAPAVTYGEGINIPGSPKGIPTGQIGPVNIGVYGGGGYSKNQEVPGVNRATTNQDLGITAEMPIGDSGFSVGGNYMKSRTNERFTGEAIPGQTFKNVPIDSDRFNVGINFKKQFADGGRIGFKKGGMDRRSFLKLMGGLASIPILGKFIKPVAKVAETAAPAIAEGVKLGYDKFLMLVDKIKKLGRKTDAVTQKEREVGYVYKGKDGNEYELVEDITTGDVRVTKDKPGGMTIGDESFDTIEDRSTFVLRRNQVDETTKGRKPPDEYDEMKEIPGPDGTFDDIDEVSDISVKEILEELGETKIKKAGGGLAHMLGE